MFDIKSQCNSGKKKENKTAKLFVLKIPDNKAIAMDNKTCNKVVTIIIAIIIIGPNNHSSRCSGEKKNSHSTVLRLKQNNKNSLKDGVTHLEQFTVPFINCRSYSAMELGN